MTNYINADLLKEKLNSFIMSSAYTDYNCGYSDCLTAVQDTISDIPAADVVKVVRCKDCKYWNGGDCFRIELTKPSDFCSYGEKKEPVSYEGTENVIGNRINILLKSSGKKQKDLAEFLDVTANTVSYYVTGTRTPNVEQIINIARFFEVSTDYILGVNKR